MTCRDGAGAPARVVAMLSWPSLPFPSLRPACQGPGVAPGSAGPGRAGALPARALERRRQGRAPGGAVVRAKLTPAQRRAAGGPPRAQRPTERRQAGIGQVRLVTRPKPTEDRDSVHESHREKAQSIYASEVSSNAPTTLGYEAASRAYARPPKSVP